MASGTEVVTASEPLFELAERLEKSEGFADVLASLRAGHAATLDGVWGSSCALAAASLLRHAPGPLVFVVPSAVEQDAVLDELSLFTRTRPEVFPASEALPDDRALLDDVFGDRLRMLKLLLAPSPPRLIVTSIQSLLQPVPDRAGLEGATRTLRVGDTLDPQVLSRWLVEHRFHHTSAVELPGEFSVRGGIIDLFSPDWDDPVRIELFGEEIDSIRRFTVATQRSLENLPSVDITVLDPAAPQSDHLCSYLPPSAWFMLLEPSQMEDEGRNYLNRLDVPEHFFSVSESLKRIFKFPSITAEAVAAGSFEKTCHLHFESVERFSGDIAKVRDELEVAGAGQDVFLVCPTSAEVQRLTELLAGSTLLADGRLHFPIGSLRSGFRLVDDRVVILSSNDLFHRPEARRASRRRLGRVIDSFLELREGDYVVHLAHGIARYRGLKLLEKNGQVEEHLELEFDGATRMYVPASKIDLVQKYVGGTKGKPSLSKLGGKSWSRQKQAAQDAVHDMAVEMLQLQAVRNSRPGIGFPSDSEWQHEFDAAFPYRETPDQLAAIAEIKNDMQAARPMDRLICGDVGYGKTEVAMRAAFKAVDAGYQVAVLVPTTVLAEQHWRTFRARMAEYPFEIAALSRFQSPGEQKKIIKRLAAGSVDVVIGTHRLASNDVQFHNLGLLMIDEEQRFGVEVKEKLKALRATVDVMTLTATPIPRTLHMSLLGLRDISNLETPPENRLAVETRVTRFDPAMIRHAVLRELSRGGQIYFVHNRVHDIEILANRLRQIVPEARVQIGHGQMHEHDLEQVMLGFVQHEFDILLATTIIESGLDIPNANTIFIDEADMYGLADLHQLRGRVGRYKHRAYCYLLIDPNKHLNPAAAKRLRAIEEFSDMGAGFALAMRDLEIRGAGNILGTQQSGHIAAVGYELYCRLLEQSVAQVKKQPMRESIEVDVDLPLEAYLPRDYVPDMRLKIDMYRRLSRLATHEDIRDFAAELHDRFGPLPQPVERMLKVAGLRIDAHHWKISAVRLEDQFAAFIYTDKKRIEQLARRSGKLRVVDERSAYLPLVPIEREDADALIARLESMLRPELETSNWNGDAALNPAKLGTPAASAAKPAASTAGTSSTGAAKSAAESKPASANLLRFRKKNASG